MHGREVRPGEGPRGGILTDSMGLGKTVEAIAVSTLATTHVVKLTGKAMIANQPGANENFLERSVLLVVPASIVSAKICLFFSPSSYLGLQLYQWYSELDKHGGDSLGIVKIYKSSENKHMTIKQLTKHNTVLASYAEVTNSCPLTTQQMNLGRKNKRAKGGDAKDDDQTRVEAGIKERLAEGKGGHLHSIKWWRVSQGLLSCSPNVS